MSIRNKFENQLKLVFDKLVVMCKEVELAIEKSMNALKSHDEELAKEVIREDRVIDNAEREIEQDCLKILLMEHPVASDFRDVSAALKMITDLERIADQAADISEISLQLCGKIGVEEPPHLSAMAKIVTGMVKDGVVSYVNRDLDTARGLDKRDDRVDQLFLTVKADLVDEIRKSPEQAEEALLYLMIAKYLERIGDHAVNIGEWAEYASTGARFH